MNPTPGRCLPFIPAASPSLVSAESLDRLRGDFLNPKFGMFIHSNMGTYHEKEWVDPGRDPASFNPARPDCGQWADAAKSAGMKHAAPTIKHHDIVSECFDSSHRRGIQP